MDVSDPSNGRDPWYTQSHYQALFFGTAVALGVSGYYYKRQHAIANCKVTDADFSNKTVIITGANTGIGFTAAEQFVELGAKVVLACRDPVKGAKAVEAIKSRHQHAHVTSEILDVSDLESIRRFSSKMDRCHVLVNNAGALFEVKEILKNGIEKTFMTNYVGPWYLTRLLLPTLAKTSVEDQCETKIVVVGSRTEQWSQLKDTFAAQGEAAVKAVFKGPLAPYKGMSAYSNSKLGNMLMTFELSRRLTAARSSTHNDFTDSPAWRDLIYYDPLKTSSNTTVSASTAAKKKPSSFFVKPPPSTADPYDSSYNAPLSSRSLAYPLITVNAVTPGMVATEIGRDVANKNWYGWLVQPIMTLTWRHAIEGGSEIVFAASQKHGETGKYFGEHSEVKASQWAQDAALGRVMWKVTEQVVHRLLTHEEHVAELLEEDA